VQTGLHGTHSDTITARLFYNNMILYHNPN
jgi:hypothetical protein